MEGDTKSKILFLSAFCSLMVFIAYVDSSNHNVAKTSNSPKVLDLSITLKEFRVAYAAKVESSKAPFFRWSDTYISDSNGILEYSYPCVEMKVYENKKTGNVNRIVVQAELFDSTGRYGKTAVLLFQSMTFSFATSVFSENMEYQSYRESILKRLYSNMDTNDYILNGNMKFSATRKGNTISLIVKAKDLN